MIEDSKQLGLKQIYVGNWNNDLASKEIKNSSHKHADYYLHLQPSLGQLVDKTSIFSKHVVYLSSGATTFSLKSSLGGENQVPGIKDHKTWGKKSKFLALCT